MDTQFDPNNRIIRTCMMGMGLEESGKHEEAAALFEKAWYEANDDLEKFISAHCLARYGVDVSARLEWFENALKYALKMNDVGIKSALPSLYASISECYMALGDKEKAKTNDELFVSSQVRPLDDGPFYHGTKADLQVGDMLMPGGESNYKSDFIMNHIYFTANIKGAVLAATLAKGEGQERVYLVAPTGEFEDDPNVTDKKFPGNLTRSYRSLQPLKIIGEATGWKEQTAEERNEWRDKLAKNQGEIIN